MQVSSCMDLHKSRKDFLPSRPVVSRHVETCLFHVPCIVAVDVREFVTFLKSGDIATVTATWVTSATPLQYKKSVPSRAVDVASKLCCEPKRRVSCVFLAVTLGVWKSQTQLALGVEHPLFCYLSLFIIFL